MRENADCYGTSAPLIATRHKGRFNAQKDTVTFADLLTDWHTASHRFETTLTQIPDSLRKTPGACGVWSVKEVIAHIAGWQREALRRFEAFQQGGDVADKTYDTDAFNAGSVSALSLLNWRETLETFTQTRDDLYALAAALPQAASDSEPRYAEWLRGLTRDLHDHTAEIQAWLHQQH